MAKTALVISGGGSKGAFAVGALKFIHSNVRPIDQFDIYCGTSTGALIAPFAACGEMDLLKHIYTTTTQNEVVILRDFTNILTDVSIHNALPLQQLINSTLTVAHFNKIMAKNIPVFLATICLQTEHLVYWSTQQPITRGDYDLEIINSLSILQAAMLGSSNQPVFMQPVQIRGKQYVDGGVRELTPLQAAIDAGAETIIAITLSPQITLSDNQIKISATQILERTLDTLSEDVGRNDYRLARIYADGNKYLQSIQSVLFAQGVSKTVIDQAMPKLGNPFVGSSITTIHEIRPQSKLDEGGPGGLFFDPVLMTQMFNKGFIEAQRFFNTLSPENNGNIFV